MIDFSTPIQGMHRAEDGLNAAADRLAKMPAAAADAASADQVDLSAQMVALMESRNNFAANVKVVHAGDEMTRATLDLLG